MKGKIIQIIPAPKNLCAEYRNEGGYVHEPVACLALVGVETPIGYEQSVQAMVRAERGDKLEFASAVNLNYAGLAYKVDIIG